MKGILHERDIIVYEGNKYRILQLRSYDLIVIQMNTIKTSMFHLDLAEVEELVETGVITIQPKSGERICVRNEMREGASLRIAEQYRIISEKLQAHSNSLEWLLDREEKAAFIQKIATEHKISLATARRRLRNYLQNGMTLAGLETGYYKCGGKGKERIYEKGNKPGRKGFSVVVRDTETIKIFNRIKNRYVGTKGKINISVLYTEMVQDYYSDRMVVNGETIYTPYPVSKRPSKRQLYYHLNKELDGVKKYCVKNGYRVARNNIRPLFSDTIKPLEIKGVGCCYEMDEMETDYELVQVYDRSKVIGRAVMYMLIDVFSKMITGYAIGVDNNSWAGAEMALLNMAEDKVSYCARFGIDIEKSDWPVSGVLPTEIMVDNGSEYLSKQFEAFATANGIRIGFAPAAMGSMKGNIESEFRRFNIKTNGVIPGQIVKGAYGQPHQKQARLTIEEFEQIVIQFIINHNKNPMDQYKDTKEIYASGIEQSPNSIWRHSLEHEHALKHIVDMNQYRLSLLCSDTATITREGLVFKKMIYVCEDRQWMANQMALAAVSRRKKVPVKFDKRCIDAIYYLNEDSEYRLAVLSDTKIVNEKYQHLSMQDVLCINENKNMVKRENEEKRLFNNINLLFGIKQQVKEAEEEHTQPNDAKNKRENRSAEKERLHLERNVISNIGNGYKIAEAEGVLEDCINVKEKTGTFIERNERTENMTFEELLEEAERRKYGIYL